MTAMIALVIAALGCAFGLVVLARRQQHGPVPILLAAVPLGMILPVLPIAPATLGMIRGFRSMAETGTAGIVRAAELSIDVSRPIFWGCLGFVVTMMVAAYLQMRNESSDPEHASLLSAPAESESAPASAQPQNLAAIIVLVGASLLAVPVATLVHLAAGVPRLVMSVAVRFSPLESTARAPNAETLQQTSAHISSSLVSSVALGVVASLMLVGAVIVILVMLRPGRTPRWVTSYSWAVAGVSVIVAAWTALVLLTDIRSYERSLSAPATTRILQPSLSYDGV